MTYTFNRGGRCACNMSHPSAHPNPPAIVFPKSVGNDELKAFIAEKISQTLNILTPEIDYSNHTLRVFLRRSKGGKVQGFLKQSIEITERLPHKIVGHSVFGQVMDLDFNLCKGTYKPSDNIDKWLNTLVHEVIHYAQTASNCFVAHHSKDMFGQTTTFEGNSNNFALLTQRVYEAIGSTGGAWGLFNNYSSEDMTLTDGYDFTYNMTKGLGYHHMKHEAQAWRQSYKITKHIFGVQPAQADINGMKFSLSRSVPMYKEAYNLYKAGDISGHGRMILKSVPCLKRGGLKESDLLTVMEEWVVVNE